MTSSPDKQLRRRGPDEQIVVVSGMSGAGKSTALHALEDLGFFCVDNIPTTVVASTLEACRQASVSRVAFGIDVRLRAFLDHFAAAIEAIEHTAGVDVTVLFLDASDQTLLSRFSATRRPHPLASASEAQEREAVAVLDGVAAEREQLARVRSRATQVIDTTALTVHQLRRRVVDLLGSGRPRMQIRMLSFGFKYGPPVDADLMLDVRFLPNPYFVDHLRDRTGLDESVIAHVMNADDTRELLERSHNLVSFCVPKYEREGKSYLTIAVGCTGGRHRSVAVAVELARRLEAALGVVVRVVHRDIQRDGSSSGAQEPDIIGGGVRGFGRGFGRDGE